MATVFQKFNSARKILVRSWRYWPVGLSFCLGVGLSAIASIAVWQWEQESAQARFSRQVDNLTNALQRHIDSYSQMTRSIGVFYTASDQVTRQDFATFAQLMPHSPGLLGMGWVQYVPGTERAAYEQSMVSEKIPNFRILERSPSGQPIAAGERAEYFPNTYIEPTSLKDLVGYDIGIEPQLRTAIEKARKTGITVTAPLISLENPNTIGFKLYSPVYDRDRPDITSDSHQAFRGAVYTVYQLKDMLNAVVGSLNLKHLNFYLYSAALDQLHSSLTKPSINAADRFLIAYDAENRDWIDNPQQAKIADLGTSSSHSQQRCPYSQDWLTCLRSLNVADREWSLLIVPAPSLVEYHWGAAATLAIGLLATSTLMVYLWMSLTATLKVRNQAQVLAQTLEQLKQTQTQLVQTEKMSSLGQLVAGITHEINNPVSFINGNLPFARHYVEDLLALLELYQKHYQPPANEIQEWIEVIDLEFLVDDLTRLLTSMEMGGKRIREIVQSMRNFSRLQEADQKPADLHEGIDNTLLLLQHRLKPKGPEPGIAVKKNYGKLPLVSCYPGLLNQVFMNILSNAIDALQEIGGERTISISTEAIDCGQEKASTNGETLKPSVAICFQDNGPGISPEVQARLFDPFFTTKPVGKGTGLGLSISYQIVVEKHKGAIECHSSPDRGTAFWLQLPLQSNGAYISRN